MKTSFKLVALFCALCASPLSLADYEGSRIHNRNDSYSGSISVTDTTSSGVTGSVYRDNAAGDGTTALTGNISIAGADGNDYGSGVYNSATSAVSVIILETSSDSDSITIRTSGNYGHGIGNYNGRASTTVHANYGGRLQDIIITTTGSNSIGIYTNGGTTDINGNVVIQSACHGLQTENTTLRMSGRVDITGSGGNRGYGINAGSNGTIDLSGTTYTNVSGGNTGVNANGGAVVLGSHLNVSGSYYYALHSHNGSSLISGTGRYSVSGCVRAYNGGAINLAMASGSLWNAYSTFGATPAGTSDITLAFQDGATWNLSRSSVLTDLTMDEGAALGMTITSTASFTDITAASAMLASGAIITVSHDGYFGQEGDTFQLIKADDFTGEGVVFQYVGTLAEGLRWDSSTFADDATIRIVAIPEPATAAFGFLVLVGASVRRRRLAEG